MDSFLNFSNENLWIEIWPELCLALAALLILGLDLFRKPDSSRLLSGRIAILFQLGLVIFHLFDYLVWHHTFDRVVFQGC